MDEWMRGLDMEGRVWANTNERAPLRPRVLFAARGSRGLTTWGKGQGGGFEKAIRDAGPRLFRLLLGYMAEEAADDVSAAGQPDPQISPNTGTDSLGTRPGLTMERQAGGCPQPFIGIKIDGTAGKGACQKPSNPVRCW
jgi:hypothetical protein